MPKAEAGTVKHLNNKLKSKGLQRLRWFCQVCEKQCRDANGFKMHTQSESHVRQMLVVGEDPKKFINEFSNQFLSDFVQLLKTGHGEKQVHINHFYQEYIANKEHIHMNATKWPSLTEFAKHLGREGICRVEENDKGIHITWVDNSPDALRRQEALRRKEAQNQGDEEVEQRMIREQIKRAQAARSGEEGAELDAEDRELKRQEGEKITLSFGSSKPKTTTTTTTADKDPTGTPSKDESEAKAEDNVAATTATEAKKPGGFSFKAAGKAPVKNVFAQAKKNALAGGGGKKASGFEQPKKMSEAERIMRQEMDRKRARDGSGTGNPLKKQRSS
ncbi:C2H2 finger domain-containing protein [Cordyceps fumosorosea ARSEF 2679]|uniref:C2H2 finger domain-containing protein n=1 Tax=Cordyceps fumosorosea (strain ARSEF 2679) TaxID=1081104 RepID=A0A168CN76_CORFA|nr:C2H2 finger domain-containing protein [Cordyceps fumosorosea ARSEF 2679]OAA71585.1 C2H2 finger domain-containing protein [Cordyceps fumosorosea ARSEF 2679]